MPQLFLAEVGLGQARPVFKADKERAAAAVRPDGGKTLAEHLSVGNGWKPLV